MTIAAIPPELIDKIVDEVDALDAETSGSRRIRRICGLKSCSLTASMFLEPSQRRLFRKFHLPPGSVKKADLLIRSPHLGRYVRDLNLSVDPDYDNFDPDLLASVLRLLVGVQRLMIFITSSWCDSNSTPNFRDSIILLLSLRSLRCVAFHCTGVPSSLVLHAISSCKEVGLHMIFDAPPEQSTTVQDDHRFAFNSNEPPHEPKLTRLVLKYIPQNCPTLHTLVMRSKGIELGKLRYLEVYAQESSIGGFEALVLKFAHSLHHLALNFPISLIREDANAPPFELPSIPTLRFLTFKTGSDTRRIQLPESLISSISSLPTYMPQLEVLTFEFEGHGEGRPRTKHRADADKALKSLPHLRHAHFILEAQRFKRRP